MAKKEKPTGKALKLKPGNHQFVPGGGADHNNDNTSAADLEWYLEKFPHIKGMLADEPEEKPADDAKTE